MTLKELWDKYKPLLDNIITFATGNVALTLGIGTAFVTVLVFVINTLDYIYQLGFFVLLSMFQENFSAQCTQMEFLFLLYVAHC